MADNKNWAKEPDLTSEAKRINILHYFSSYTYNFTLSCVEDVALSYPEQYYYYSQRFVVLKSSGKVGALDPDNILPVTKATTPKQKTASGHVLPPTFKNDYGGADLVKGFNQDSPGRFNMFINDLEIESLLAFDKRTGFAKANKIKFTVHEPYSLSGFLEALQTTAVAAGHPSYQSAPFVIALDFVGYPDWTGYSIPEPMRITEASRYFVIRFTEVQIKADETGTRYQCEAVPINEIGFGEPNKLPSNVTIKGNTVKEILKDLMSVVNRTKKELNFVSPNANISGNQAQCDEYEIYFPSVNDAGVIDFNTTNSFFADSQVAELSVDDVPYAFLDPVVEKEKKDQEASKKPNSKARSVKYTPQTASVMFSQNANIHDCISAIIRDSKKIRKIFANFKGEQSEGLIDYFYVGLDIIPKKTWDESRNQPFYTYRYYVLPYEIHYTRIPQFQDTTIDTRGIKQQVRRHYNYFYTGQNIDVLSFNVKYDYLYFQATPAREGNNPLIGRANAVQDASLNVVTKQTKVVKSKDVAKGSGNVPAPVIVYQSAANIQFSGEQTRPVQADRYASLVKNLHEALIENYAMSVIDLEIIGDPYFLVQGGIGNIKTVSHPDFRGITLAGDADHTRGDIYVSITFRNPVDIDIEGSNAGMMKFKQESVISGLYRVNTVTSRFSDGVFKQVLNMYRIPGQPTETKLAEDQPFDPGFNSIQSA